jgi:hypothetical protein
MRISSIPILVIFLCVNGIAGCSGVKKNKLPSAAMSILEKAEEIELISLDPGHPEKDERPPKGDYFGWKELGRTTIEDAETRRRVVSAVATGLAEATGAGANCFDPRHALHASHKDKTVEILICFQCSQVLVYVNDKRQDPYLAISGSPQPVLDKILADANVPLAPKPEH